jgi:hypothetical protein
LGIGSAVLAAAGVAHAAQNEHANHRPLTGPLASATVSFGAWPVGTVEAPRDRFTLPFAPQGANVHALLPHEVTIKEGGSVNFVLAGFHHVVVYAPGKDQFVLANAKTPGSEAGAANDSTNPLYILQGKNDELRQHIGQQVEVVGKPQDSSASASDSSPGNTRRLEVESVRMIAANCAP